MKRLIAVLLSVGLLAPAWLGAGGFFTLVGLVPLLWISSTYGGSRRDWWGMFGWALAAFVGWNLATSWWVGYATWVGPLGATLFSTFWSLVPFMLFHTVSKRAPKSLAYTLLVAAWIACEWAYHQGSFSYPWLTLGNAFSRNIQWIQWYEATGIFGGSLWVLVSNVLIFELLTTRRKTLIWWTLGVVLVPMLTSQVIYRTYKIPTQRTITATIVQPNIDPYTERRDMTSVQQENLLLRLIGEAPANTDVIVLPETTLQTALDEAHLETERPVRKFTSLMQERYPRALLVVGVETCVDYDTPATPSVRTRSDGTFYDMFNATLALDSMQNIQKHHKGKLVIGVENTPGWVFRALKFITVDLGGTVGSLGMGKPGPLFTHNGIGYGSTICWEAVYGEFYGDVVRDGAQVMCVSSNDGWWRDTPGHRLLFAYSQMRAIETRRAVVRSANTGTSGFINSRGDAIEKLGWAKQGVFTQRVELNSRTTLYTRFGDYIGRLALFVSILSILAFIVYLVRKRNHLV